jgi:hypothetical protein
VVVAVLTAFLMVFVLPVGMASAAAPNLTPGPAYTVWAYGAVRTVDFTGASGQGFTYEGHATYGYSVILSQTNLTNQTFELTVNRTMGASLAVEYCFPNCQHPSVTANVTHKAWEAVNDYANFTTNGTVSENGQNASAIALMNSHSIIVGNLTDVAQGPMRTSYLSAHVTASASVNFATPLGLFPNTLTTPLTWSSSSAYTASGSYTIAYLYSFIGPHTVIHIGPGTSTGSVARNGTVTVTGSTTTGPSGAVDFGGLSYLNVSLNVEGPFQAREGFILVPNEVDLFANGGSSVWNENESGGTTVQMTSLYYRPGNLAHLGIGGSEWLYGASSLNPGVAAFAMPGTGGTQTLAGTGVTQIAAGADDVGSTPVQGVPVNVDQAQGYQGCLISGGGCPASSSPRSLLPFIGIGILAVIIAAVVASVVVAGRRRLPPPVYPNAKLYPPGVSEKSPPLPSARPATDRRAPTAEDDPLSNLW